MFFKKKESGKIGRKINIPPERMRETAILLDADEKEKTKVSKYDLWIYLGEIVPETRDGHWRLCPENATRYYVEEVLR